MNNIELSKTGGLPLTTRVLDFMQESYTMLEALVELAGSLVFISGCEINTATKTVSDGIISVGKTIYEFTGGRYDLYPRIRILTKYDTELFHDGSVRSIYRKKKAVLTDQPTGAGVFDFSSFKHISSIKNIDEILSSMSIDWGSITHKPVVFPPEQHKHHWNQITNKPDLAPARHRHSWTEIAHKPTTFTPKEHQHYLSEIRDSKSYVRMTKYERAKLSSIADNDLNLLIMPYRVVEQFSSGGASTFDIGTYVLYHQNEWTNGEDERKQGTITADIRCYLINHNAGQIVYLPEKTITSDYVFVDVFLRGGGRRIEIKAKKGFIQSTNNTTYDKLNLEPGHYTRLLKIENSWYRVI